MKSEQDLEQEIYKKRNFKVESLLNELATVLILLELYVEKKPMIAAEISKEIRSRFLDTDLNPNFIFQPSLIYNIMKDFRGIGLISRNNDDNSYVIEKKGEEYLVKHLNNLKEFNICLEHFINDASI